MKAKASLPARQSEHSRSPVFVPVLFPRLAIMLAVLFWGGSFAVMKVVVHSLDPWSVMWARSTLALLLLLPFSKKLWPHNYRQGDWKLLLPLILLMPCLYFLLESYALCYTTSSQAGIISAAVPLFVAMGAWLAFRERITNLTWAGLIFSISGVAWLTLAGLPSEQAINPVLGNMLEFGAMLGAAGYMLLLKKLSRRYSPWTLTALQALGGSIFFLPGAVSVLGGKAWSLADALGLLYLGSCVSLGSFGLYNWAISRIPASQAAAFINLVPVAAVLIGWSQLGEALSPGQGVAAALAILGVCLCQMANRSR
ncbi:MAG: DMT family transporter [Desulfarculaceae bacterium]